jgi:small subunit ribosomal protein S18
MFCSEKTTVIDYKDVSRLRRFVTERGKILPRRVSGNCARHQRVMARAVKQARELALLPYTSE